MPESSLIKGPFGAIGSDLGSSAEGCRFASSTGGAPGDPGVTATAMSSLIG
jgi:hypothetical protein